MVVGRQTQPVQRNGELYRVMNASYIPLTLTGTWDADAPKLQEVGDAALRAALALPTGAGLTGFTPSALFPSGTVGKRLSLEITPFDFGALGNGVVDDSAAYVDWAASTIATNKLIPTNTFKCTQPLIFRSRRSNERQWVEVKDGLFLGYRTQYRGQPI